MLCYKFQYECSKLFKINPQNETFLCFSSPFSLYLLHVNHLFFTLSLSLSLSLCKKKKSHMLPLAGGSIMGQARSQMRGLRGRSEVAQAGAVMEISPSAWHSSSGGIPARHDCTRLRVYKDKKWSFNANLFNFPQRSFRALCLGQCCSFFFWRRDVSVTSSPPENISHDAAV